MRDYQVVIDEWVKQGYLTPEDAHEIEEKAEALRKHANAQAAGRLSRAGQALYNLILPAAVLSSVAPVAIDLYDRAAAPYKADQQFNRMVERYPDLKKIRTAEDKPIQASELREAYDVGRHLAPYVMQNPTLAAQITRNFAESQSLPVNWVSTLVDTQAKALQAHKATPSRGDHLREKLRPVSGIISSPVKTVAKELGEMESAELAGRLRQQMGITPEPTDGYVAVQNPWGVPDTTTTQSIMSGGPELNG